jgi:hypothetical protein
VLLRLFWYQFHAHLTNGSTGVVCHCPQDMGALSVLSLKKNRLCTKGAGKALAQALAENTTLRELDVSDNRSPIGDNSARDGPGFALELAVGSRDNGTLAKLDMSSNKTGAEQEEDLERICMAGGIEFTK